MRMNNGDFLRQAARLGPTRRFVRSWLGRGSWRELWRGRSGACYFTHRHFAVRRHAFLSTGSGTAGAQLGRSSGGHEALQPMQGPSPGVEQALRFGSPFGPGV